MKITESILAQLTDTDALMESLYGTIAEADADYEKEMESYAQAVGALLQEAPKADAYLQARRQELASDLRFAMWQGFMWNLECFRNPVNKLLAQLDFEELCQESQMHTLPAAQVAQAAARAFTQCLPEEKLCLLEPISDHFAYLETYGYKLAHCAGFQLASKLLPQVVPGFEASWYSTGNYFEHKPLERG